MDGSKSAHGTSSTHSVAACVSIMASTFEEILKMVGGI